MESPPVEERLSHFFSSFSYHFFVVLSSLCGQHFPFYGEESLRVNLNVLGDSVVSFAVLALSASPDGSMVAACTDRSRVIVLQVGWGLVTWNLVLYCLPKMDQNAMKRRIVDERQ